MEMLSAKDEPKPRVKSEEEKDVVEKNTELKAKVETETKKAQDKGEINKLIDQQENVKTTFVVNLKKDVDAQKDSIKARIAERKKNMAEGKSPKKSGIDSCVATAISSAQKAQNEKKGDDFVESQGAVRMLADFEEEVENEIDAIWTEVETELEKEQEKRRQELEELYEKEANEKHERLAEMKAEYNILIRNATTDAEKDLLQEERDTKIGILKKDLEMKQQLKVKEMKDRH